MMINSNTLVSITEANQNFSKVARLVDEQGSAVILKNNVPRYLIVEFSQAEQMQAAEDETASLQVVLGGVAGIALLIYAARTRHPQAGPQEIQPPSVPGDAA